MTRRQRFFLLVGFTLALNAVAFGQLPSTSAPADSPAGRLFTLYGDFAVIEPEVEAPANTMFDLILYSRANEVSEVARQRVGKGGRYSFENIIEGNYVIGVEFENVEIARVPIHIAARKHEPIRQDMQLNWTSSLAANREFVSAPGSYERNSQHRKLFDQAMKQINKNELPKATATLRSIVEADPKDYQSWNELGLVYFIQKDFNAAENSYEKAIEVKPDYITAFVNLGRVRLAQKKNEGAIAAFRAGLEKDSKSALANYFLGEAYFAARKELIAVVHMNEALKLAPERMANAHLRI